MDEITSLVEALKSLTQGEGQDERDEIVELLWVPKVDEWTRK